MNARAPLWKRVLVGTAETVGVIVWAFVLFAGIVVVLRVIAGGG